MVFEIFEHDGKTAIRFTQHGLTPAYECFNVCNDAWTLYLQGSLHQLITTGKGEPTTREHHEINTQLAEKWGLEE